MDHSGHIRVKQANKLEVAGSRETYGIGWRIYRRLRIFSQSQDSRGDARGTVKAGPIRGKPRAPDRDVEDGTKARWPGLAGF